MKVPSFHCGSYIQIRGWRRGGFCLCVSAKLNGVRMASCHIRPDTTAKNTARMAVAQKRNDLHFLTTSVYRRTPVFNFHLFKREFIVTRAELRAGGTAA